MYTKLSLRNFRQHTSLDIDFTQGMNGIFGPNYSGKSSVLDGIFFCLGGAGNAAGRELLKRGAKPASFVQTLWFEDQYTKPYKIIRKKGNAELYRLDGEEETLLAAGHTPVTDAVGDILGFPVKELRQWTLIRQKESAQLLSAGPTAIHTLLEKAVKSYEVTEAIEKLKGINKNTKMKLEGVRESLMPEETYKLQLAEVSELESEIETKSQELTECSTQWEATKVSYREIRALYEDQRQTNSQGDSVLKSIDSRKANLEVVQEDILTLEKKLEDLPKLAEGKLEEVTQAEKEAHEIVSELQKQQGSLLVIEAELVDRKEEVAELNKAKEKFEGRLEKLGPETDAKEVEEVEEFLREKTLLKSELQSKRDKLKGEIADGVCQSCNRPFEDFDPEQKKKELEELKPMLAEVTGEVADWTDRAKKLRAAADLWSSLHTELVGTVAQIKLTEARIAKLKKQRKEAKGGGDLEEARSRLTELRLELKGLQELDNQIKDLTKMRGEKVAREERIHKELDTLKLPEGYSQETEAELHQQMSEAREATVKLSGVAELLKEAVDNRQKRLQTLQGSLDRHEASLKTVTELAELEDRSERLVAFLRVNRDQLMDQVWLRVLADASQFASNASDGAIEALHRTEEGRFAFRQNDQVFDIADASGAQEALLGISLKVAMYHAAACQFGSLVLDEPAADMDETHSLSLSAMLQGSADQVVVVSHHQMDTSMCNNLVQLGN